MRQPNRIAWSIREVADAIGVSQGHVRNAIEDGSLRHTKVGRRVLILDGALREWLHETEQDAAPVIESEQKRPSFDYAIQRLDPSDIPVWPPPSQEARNNTYWPIVDDFINTGASAALLAIDWAEGTTYGEVEKVANGVRATITRFNAPIKILMRSGELYAVRTDLITDPALRAVLQLANGDAGDVESAKATG